jgi:hypothetical protein
MLTDGEPLRPLAAALPDLVIFAQAMQAPLPIDPFLAQYWTDSTKFGTAIFALVACFGMQDPSVPTFDAPAGPEALRRWRLDTTEITKATGIQWPSWQTWGRTLEVNIDRMQQYCKTIGKVAPNWYDVHLEQGLRARMRFGYRIPEIPEMEGVSHYDHFVDRLVRDESMLDRADAWAERLSVSPLLSELLLSGVVDQAGRLLWTAPWERSKAEVFRFLGLNPNSVSFLVRCVKTY